MSEARYTCRDCGNDKTFTVKKSLKRHREEVHGEGQPSANQKIECAPCKKLFSREENFKRHVAQLHTETNLVVCHLCNKKKRKDALREHLRACEKRPGNREPAPVIILEETPERTNQTSQPIEPSPSVFEPSTLPRTWTTQTQHHDTSHALGREEREGIDSMQPVYSARADQPPEPSALVRQHRFDPPSFASLHLQSNAYSDFPQAFPHQQAQIASPNEQPSGHSWSSLDPGPGSVETRHGGHQDWAREHLLQDASLTERIMVYDALVAPIDNETECLDVLLQVAATRQPVQLLATLSSASQLMEEQMKKAEENEDPGFWNTNLLLIKAYEKTLKVHGIFSLRALAEELQVRNCKFVPIPWHQHLAKAQRKIGKQEGIKEGEARRAKRNELKGAESTIDA
ncbi:hypothetical protein MBLNU230_g3454t1 [Neophaeotheca triangularis]